MMDDFRMNMDRTACYRAISIRDARFVSRALTPIESSRLGGGRSAVGLVRENQ